MSRFASKLARCAMQGTFSQRRPWRCRFSWTLRRTVAKTGPDVAKDRGPNPRLSVETSVPFLRFSTAWQTVPWWRRL